MSHKKKQKQAGGTINVPARTLASIALPETEILETAKRTLRREQFAGVLGSIANNLIRCTGAAVIASYGYLSIRELTSIDAARDVGTTLFGELAALLAGGCGIAYGIRQRSLRRRTMGQPRKHNEYLRQHRAADYDSSGLSRRGKTLRGEQIQ